MLHNEQLKKARILIVDDQEANVYLLERILRGAGFTGLKSLTDSREVPSAYSEFRPDLLLLDLHMPHQDGFAVLEALKALIPAGAFLPILVLTADITPQAKQRALSGGAKDFLTKPFDPTEVLRRLREAPETRNTPVVVISADATPGQIDRVLAAGAWRYLTKPLDVKKCLALLDEALARPEAGRAGRNA